MKKALILAFLFPLTLIAQIHYPTAKTVEQEDNYYGKKVADPYRWMEETESSDIKNWVEEQNKLSASYLAAIPYREKIRKTLMDASHFTSYSSPVLKGDYYYFSRHEDNKEHSIIYRQRLSDSSIAEVLDPNKFSEEGTTSIGEFIFSKDSRYAAFSLYDKGSDWAIIRVMDMTTLQSSSEQLHWTKHSTIAWQGHGFYYCRYPAPGQGQELISKNDNEKIYYHTVGTDQEKDKLIYQDSIHAMRTYSVKVSEDESHFFMTISNHGMGWNGNALYYKSIYDKELKYVESSLSKGGYSYIASIGKYFIINKNGSIVKYDTASKEISMLIEAYEPISSIRFAGGKFFITYMKDVYNMVRVYDIKGHMETQIKLPGLGSVSGFDGTTDSKEVFYTFSSFTTPPTVYRYDITQKTSTLFRRSEFKHDLSDYETEQVFYTSDDNTQIPMFLVHKKGVVLNGTNPTILHGYGGFGISVLPVFNATLIPFLEAGGIYASANIRGGGEYGGAWYSGGVRNNKQNSFDDFICAAKYLIKKKYTDKDHLAIKGASNGGVLIGAVCNQHPELFKVAIAEVGVMDMLRFQKFTVGLNWKAEYGSSSNSDEFETLYRYSPLHNINPQKQYPAMLITTADHDDRVVPAHSYKYTAALQSAIGASNKAPLLLRVDHNSGHGSSTMSKYIDRLADIYSFIFYNMGVSPKID